MAQKYRKIDPRIWSDEKFTKLSSDEKLIAIYVLTAQTNRIGLFKFSPALAAEDLGMNVETFAKRFARVRETLRWGFDEVARVVWIPRWWRYNRPDNPNVLKNCLGDLHELPQTALLNRFANNLADLPETFGVTFRCEIQKPTPQPPPNQEQEQEQDQKQEQEFPAARAAGSHKGRKAASGLHAATVTHFCEAWEAKYGAPYPFNGGKDGEHVKWMLGRVNQSATRAAEIIDAYLADDRTFYADDRHSLGLLKSQFRRFITDAPRANGSLGLPFRAPTADELATLDRELK
jgi:hypothetical protein